MNDIIKTLKYKHYEIYLDKEINSLKCLCLIYSSQSVNKTTKFKIFESIYNLGKDIYNLISEKSKIIINPELENSILLKKRYNGKELFLNLNELINSEQIKKVIINYFEQNGIPNFMYSQNYITDTISPDGIKEFNKKTCEIIEKSGYLKWSKSNNRYIDIQPLTDREKKLYPFLNDFTINKNTFEYFTIINLTPLINISLLVFFINTIKTKITNAKTSNLSWILISFPKLSTIYSNYIRKKQYISLTVEEKENNTKILKSISTFFKLLTYYSQIYIKNNINIFNNTEISFPEIIDFPNEDNINSHSFDFFNYKYISLNPFLTAFEYLTNNLKPYHCEECDNIMEYKQHLCFDCKIREYEKRLSRYEDDLLRKEMNNLLKNKYSPTPLIEKKYYDSKYQKERYNKKK